MVLGLKANPTQFLVESISTKVQFTAVYLILMTALKLHRLFNIITTKVHFDRELLVSVPFSVNFPKSQFGLVQLQQGEVKMEVPM